MPLSIAARMFYVPTPLFLIFPTQKIPDLNAPLEVCILVPNVNIKHDNGYYDDSKSGHFSSICGVSDTG